MADYNGQYTGQQIDEAVGKVSELSLKMYEKPDGGIPASDLASGVIPDVSGKEDKMIDATALPSGVLVDGTKYVLSQISNLDLTVNTIPTSNKRGILIYFTAGSEGCILSTPSGTKWYGGDAPTFTAGTSYVIMICDGICGCINY